MMLDLMFRLGDAYGWSKNDLSSFSGGELLQILKRLIKNEKERGNNKTCPMLNALELRR